MVKGVVLVKGHARVPFERGAFVTKTRLTLALGKILNEADNVLGDRKFSPLITVDALARFERHEIIPSATVGRA